MVSSNLTTLRNTPPQQGNIYQTALRGLVKLRSAANPGTIDMKVQGQQQISQTGLTALQGLLDQSNAAEKAIRGVPINLDETPPSSAALDNCRWLFDKRIDITDMCTQFIRQRDREGFKALRSLLPWAATAGMLGSSTEGYPERRIGDAMKVIRAAEAPLMTKAELAQAGELRELDISMPYLRQNFDRLSDWLQAQGRPASLDGYSGGRLQKINAWLGLPGSTVPPFILLPDDFSGQYSSLDANRYLTGIASVDNMSQPPPTVTQWVQDGVQVKTIGYPVKP